MVEARDPVLISFPFAAGVALAQFCPFPLFHYSLALTALLLLLMLGGRLSGRLWYALLFAALGALCGELRGDAPPVISGGLASRALAHTDALIRSIPFAHGGTNELLRALLTGQRDGLARETADAFRAAGASHILALSGLHLGIIYLIIGKLLTPLGNGRVSAPVRSGLIIAACTFYALMTGASPSTVRALLFISLNEILRHFPGRKKSPIAIWCCALLIQLAACPWVITSLGFQLSYLAMLGIFLLFPKLDAWFPSEGRRKGPVKWMWSSMALSISCQIFTAPLVWLHFRTYPKHFLLTNLIALPLTSLLMFGAVACLVLSAFGICPTWLVWTVDALAGALQYCLSIIADLA